MFCNNVVRPDTILLSQKYLLPRLNYIFIYMFYMLTSTDPPSRTFQPYQHSHECEIYSCVASFSWQNGRFPKKRQNCRFPSFISLPNIVVANHKYSKTIIIFKRQLYTISLNDSYRKDNARRRRLLRRHPQPQNVKWRAKLASSLSATCLLMRFSSFC